MSFYLSVASIEKKLFEGEADEVILPGVDGIMTILGKHMPIITPLKVGEVVIKTKEEMLYYSIGKGVFSFNDNEASLLIEDATATEALSEEEVLNAKRKAEEIIEKGVQGEEMQKALYKLRKSIFDLKIIKRRKLKRQF
jgi:F-type H+-transporting ATPase subunit epsilon